MLKRASLREDVEQDNTSPFGSVHIRDKTSVGDRLAAAGIGLAYGSSETYWQGPTVAKAVATSAGAVEVTFANTVGGTSLSMRRCIFSDG